MKRRSIAWIILAAALSIGVQTPGTAADVVEILLNGRYYSEPATVRIMVAVQPDEQNRMLRIEADSADLFRASEFTLNGADEKRLHTVVFKGLPAGYYTLRAQVRSSTSVRGTAMHQVTVTGVGLQ